MTWTRLLVMTELLFIVGLVYQLFLLSQAPKNRGQPNPAPAELLFPSYLGNKQHGEGETEEEVGIQVKGDVHGF